MVKRRRYGGQGVASARREHRVSYHKRLRSRRRYFRTRFNRRYPGWSFNAKNVRYANRRSDQIYGYNFRKFAENYRWRHRTFDGEFWMSNQPMVNRQLQGSLVAGRVANTLGRLWSPKTRLPSDYVGPSSLARPSYGGDLQAGHYFWELYPSKYRTYPHSNTSFDHPTVPSEKEQIKEAIRYANNIDRRTMWQLGYYPFRARMPGNLGDVRFIGDIRLPRTVKYKWYDLFQPGKNIPGQDWTLEQPRTIPTATDDVIRRRRSPCYHYATIFQNGKKITKKIPCAQKAIFQRTKVPRQYPQPNRRGWSTYRRPWTNYYRRQPRFYRRV